MASLVDAVTSATDRARELNQELTKARALSRVQVAATPGGGASSRDPKLYKLVQDIHRTTKRRGDLDPSKRARL